MKLDYDTAWHAPETFFYDLLLFGFGGNIARVHDKTYGIKGLADFVLMVDDASERMAGAWRTSNAAVLPVTSIKFKVEGSSWSTHTTCP